MIVNIYQLTSNIEQTYTIGTAGFQYKGRLGRFLRFQSIYMENKDSVFKAKFKITPFQNHIPLRYLFGCQNLTKQFIVYHNDEKLCTITCVKTGRFSEYYTIRFNDRDILKCYPIPKDYYEYICVYKDDVQIAMVKTYMTTDDFKYNPVLYISDIGEKYAEVLSLFTLYYANFHFTHRFHFSSGTTSVRTVLAMTKYADKLDENWIDNNFGAKHL